MIKVTAVSSSQVLQTRAAIARINRAAFLVIDTAKDMCEREDAEKKKKHA